MTELLSILTILKKSANYLELKGIDTAKCDSEWIVSHVLGCSRMALFLRFEEILNEENLKSIRNLVVSRGKRIPLQHLLGSVSFAGLTLKCDARALIPRPETEMLVEIVLQKLDPGFSGNIIDLGTGSGAIILGLCSSLPLSTGLGLEKSASALSLARENLISCRLEKRVRILAFDWMKDQLKEKVDLLISNPPYLAFSEWEKSEPEVRVYDPSEALVANNKGASDLLRIVEMSKQSMAPNAILALEFGCSHADLIQSVLQKDFRVEIFKDLGQRRRFAIAEKL